MAIMPQAYITQATGSNPIQQYVAFVDGSGNVISPIPNVYNVKAAPYNARGDGTTDDTTAIQAAHDAAKNSGVASIVFFPAGTYKITAKLTWGTAVNVYWVGVSHFGSAISQFTANTPVVDFDQSNIYGWGFIDLQLGYNSAQSSAQTNAYCWQASVAGSPANGVFQGNFHNVKFVNGYRGFGINKSSGSVALWDIHFSGSIYFIDCSGNAVYWHNPTAIGCTTNTVESWYIQNPVATMANPAVDLQAVEVDIRYLDIENTTGAKTNIVNKLIQITSTFEPVTIGILHVENVTWTTDNTRGIDLQSTGYLSIGMIVLKACVVNVAAAGNCYLIVPGGGRVDVGSLYYTLTNTAGALAFVASGTGLVTLANLNGASTGTLLVTHSFDTAAQALLNWPVYQQYTPTVTQLNAISTWTTNQCWYKMKDKKVHVYGYLVVNNAGTATGANIVTITLPINAAFRVAVSGQPGGTGYIVDNSAGPLVYRALVLVNAAGNIVMSPTNTTATGGLGTQQFTAALATGDTITFALEYEAA